MAIFNSYVSHYQRVSPWIGNLDGPRGQIFWIKKSFCTLLTDFSQPNGPTKNGWEPRSKGYISRSQNCLVKNTRHVQITFLVALVAEPYPHLGKAWLGRFINGFVIFATQQRYRIPGWCFGPFGLFFPSYRECHNSQLTHTFRGVGWNHQPVWFKLTIINHILTIY